MTVGVELRGAGMVMVEASAPFWKSRTRTLGVDEFASFARAKTRRKASRPCTSGMSPAAVWVLWVSCIPARRRLSVTATAS